MTLQKSLSATMIQDDNDTARWNQIPHCMTDWGKITKVYRMDSMKFLHLKGHVLVGHFYYVLFDFQQDSRFVVPISMKTTAFNVQPSKN